MPRTVGARRPPPRWAFRRTRILVTVGPATRGREVLRRLLDAGSDAFRINFSHGSDREHRAAIRDLRAVSTEASREVAVVADLQGPKIRLGDLSRPSVSLRDGDEWRLDPAGPPGDARRAPVTLPDLGGAARTGDRVLVGDGSIELVVIRREEGSLVTRVVHGGPVSSRAGLFLPNAHLRAEVLGPKDLHDLAVALREGVDFVALSFVRDADDVRAARRRIVAGGGANVGLIAKIERAEALRHVEAILDASDGLMVARGDLGIEVPLERLALEQKRLVASANAAGKCAIVATQMLLSMVSARRPTRAEATDVANAVLDGTDAVMLSEESAIGHYPVEAVSWLDRICRSTEAAAARGEVAMHRATESGPSIDRSVAGAAVALSEGLGAAAIIAPTHSGRTARLIASRRPSAPILALSSQSATRRQLSLTWGVEALAIPKHLGLTELRDLAVRLAGPRRTEGESPPVVLTAGYPVEGLPTNLVTVIRTGPARPGREGSRRARPADRRGSAGRGPRNRPSPR